MKKNLLFFIILLVIGKIFKPILKNSIYILILFMSSNLFSQENYTKLPLAKTQNPSYVFNKNIIGSEILLNSLVLSEKGLKKLVKEISILKDKPEKGRDDYYNLSQHGLIFVELNKKLICKTQSELNNFFGITRQNEIYVDGYLVESKKYEIALMSIIEIELIEPSTNNRLKRRTLNVWTLNKNERYAKQFKNSSPTTGKEK